MATVKIKPTHSTIDKDALTPLQVKLCESYLQTDNLRLTSKLLGVNYRKVLKSMKKPHVWDYYTELVKEREERCQVNADRVLDELSKIAFTDISSILAWKKVGKSMRVQLKDVDQIPPEVLACIQEIKEVPTDKGKILQVKLYNKLDALLQLGKHVGLNQGTVKIGDVDAATLFGALVTVAEKDKQIQAEAKAKLKAKRLAKSGLG